MSDNINESIYTLSFIEVRQLISSFVTDALFGITALVKN